MALKWIDNKSVHMVTSLINSNVGNVEGRKKGQSEKIRVDCPGIVKHYNQHMGDVDLNDRMKSTHEQDRRAKLYYLRLAFDIFDQLMMNSRIVYNTLNPEDKLSAKDHQLRISEGIVAGFSSRSRGTSTHKISQQLDKIQLDLGAPHLPMWGKRHRCRTNR